MKIKTYTKEQLEYFPFYICSTDIKYHQERIVRPEGFKNHQLFIVSGGNGIVKANGKCYEIEKNDLFYISPGTPHEYYGTDDEFETSYLAFYSDNFESVKKYYNIRDFELYKNKNRGRFESHLNNIYDNINFTHEISTLSAMTYSAVIAFFDEACKKEYSPIERVYNYIESNYSKMITLEDILLFYPYSKTKLCHDFKQNYKMTVFDMITKVRLNNARNMIKINPHIKLSKIAESCGFGDVSYFCKMYKKFYGISPKQTK